MVTIQEDTAGRRTIDRRAWPDDKRIKFIRTERWIGYGAAHDALDRMEDLLTHPPCDRMPCLLIYGATGIGKTKIIRKFLRDHPSVFNTSTGVTSMPVVAFQMPAEPDERSFYAELYRALGAPNALDWAPWRLKQVVRNLLVAGGTRMLIIDEIHSMLAGTARAQLVFLNTLRFLANEIRAPLVCAGTDEARLALLTDSQLSERFDALMLPRWSNDGELARLLVTIALTLPLRKECRLDSKTCREIILRRTDGVTTRIFRLIESAAIRAIRDGSECITEETLSSKDLVLPLVSMTRKSERGISVM